MSNKNKHLDYIQTTISRLAQNSFLIKGWSVLAASAVFAIVFREDIGVAAQVAIVPVVMFWALDAFYLATERRYRLHFDKVRLKEEAEIDFNMLPETNVPFTYDFARAATSPTQLIHYPTLIVLLLLASNFLSEVV